MGPHGSRTKQKWGVPVFQSVLQYRPLSRTVYRRHIKWNSNFKCPSRSTMYRSASVGGLSVSIVRTETETVKLFRWNSNGRCTGILHDSKFHVYLTVCVHRPGRRVKSCCHIYCAHRLPWSSKWPETISTLRKGRKSKRIQGVRKAEVQN
jgi:hypothetical protein